jgi:coenzyme F420 hydrogenase subunit beta
VTPASPAERLYRICEEGLCIGCGLCQAVAGRDKIRIVVTPEGALRPLATEALDHATVDRIYATCPGTRVEGLPLSELEPGGEVDLHWGVCRRLVRAHAAEETVRFRGATGGVLTALSLYLLESGRVDFVLHAGEHQSQPSFGERRVSRSREDILAGAGSRYGPTATLIDIDAQLSRGQPFAFVGTPCDVTALRNLAHHDARVDELVQMIMAPVCGGFMQTSALERVVEGMGVPFERVTALRYRGYGCPGPTRMELDDGTAVEKSYLEFWGEDDSAWSLPWRCKLCPDGIAEAADIAAADTWPGGAPSAAQASNHALDPGSNALLIRSARGAALLEDSVRAGYLSIEEEALPVRQLDAWQPHQVRKKHALRPRFRALEDEGRLVPETARLRIDELGAGNDFAVEARERAGTRERIRAGKASEPRPRAAASESGDLGGQTTGRFRPASGSALSRS